MATKKRTGNKQPADDPALEDAAEAAVDEAKDEDVATADEPDDSLHLRDRLPE